MSQQINLYNPVFLQQKKIFSSRTMAGALLVLFLGVAAINVYGNMRVKDLQQQADAGAAQLAQKQARLASVTLEFVPRQKTAEVAAELAEVEGQLAALREVSGVLARGELGNTQGYAEYFRALARQHVDGLWLTGVSIAGAGLDIGVRGRALDPQRVPGYLNRLTAEPIMRGKAFGSLQIGQGVPVARIDASGKDVATRAPYVEFSLQSTPEGAKP
ncbi:PilN domain-containing protein [Massilia sp. CMS3.1]|uniref:PilN domain-containing protein n=1 Tax=Massilia sp. CMS3.1 TaxID=3373083 RepID=UPI003EE7F5BE